MNYELLERLHQVIVAGKILVDDQTASIAPELYNILTGEGTLIKAGTRINWNGTLKRANVDLWDIAENNPDNAPTLWTAIAYKKGYRIVPEIFTAENAAMKDEYLWFGEKLYKSLMDGNVYTPEQAPNNWELVENKK